MLYVDDLLLTGTSRSRIQAVQQALSERSEMVDLGLAHYFLGFQVTQTDTGISISQQKYALDLLHRFRMADYNPSPTPFQSGVTLTSSCTSPLCDATLYC